MANNFSKFDDQIKVSAKLYMGDIIWDTKEEEIEVKLVKINSFHLLKYTKNSLSLLLLNSY